MEGRREEESGFQATHSTEQVLEADIGVTGEWRALMGKPLERHQLCAQKSH
jgi:hypothetical protein